MNNHLFGILIVASGVFVMSFDTVLVRLAEVSGYDVAFWRGALIATTMATAITARRFIGGRLGGMIEEKSGIIASVRASGPPIFIIAAIMGCSSFLFPMAVMNTKAANALVILSATPLCGAVLSRFILGEHLPLRTFIAILIVMGGIAFVFMDSLGGGTLAGDLMAAGTTLCLSGVFTALRRFPHVSRLATLMLGGICTACLALPNAQPFSVPGESMLWLAILGMVVMPLSTALMTAGTQYITSAEIGLLMIGETILGIVWVFMVYGELPSDSTFLGGTIVVSTLIIHSWLGVRAHRAEASGNAPASQPADSTAA